MGETQDWSEVDPDKVAALPDNHVATAAEDDNPEASAGAVVEVPQEVAEAAEELKRDTDAKTAAEAPDDDAGHGDAAVVE